MEALKAVSYQRVSTKDRQKTDRQVADITAYCSKENIHLVKTFDDKIGGTIRTKPELKNLISYVENNTDSIKYIIFSELSRLHRDTELVLNFLNKMNSLKICSIFLKDGKKTLKEDGTVDTDTMMLLTIISSIDVRELNTLSYRIKSALSNAASKGHVGGGVLPYGYSTVSKENKTMTIHQEESEVIKTIFKLNIDNNSTIQIARYLNTKKFIPRKLKRWTNSSIYGILINPLYSGVRKFKDEIYECPAIISKETFKEVQNKLKSRASMGGGKLKHTYLLNNRKIVCGVCGKYYFPQYKAKTSYYCCGSTINLNTPCGNVGISVQRIETIITDIIINKFPNLITKNTNVSNYQIKIDKLIIDVNDYTNYLNKLVKKENNYIEMRAEDELSKAKFIELVTPLRNEIRITESKVKAIEAEITSIQAIINNKLNISEIIANWKEKGADIPILKKIIDKVVINSIPYEELTGDEITYTEEDGTEIYEKDNFVNRFTLRKQNTIYKLELYVYVNLTIYCSVHDKFYLLRGEYYSY